MRFHSAVGTFRLVSTLAMLAAILLGCCSVQGQTGCSCWGTVSNWQGTFSLTLTGSGQLYGGAESWQATNSAQGSFEIQGGTSTVSGSGSYNTSLSVPCAGGTAPICTAMGSGTLDASSQVFVAVDITNCMYRLVVADELNATFGQYQVPCGPQTGSSSGLVSPSGGLAGTDAGGLGASLPDFPLPACGEALAGSATNSGSGVFSCIPSSQATQTLVISWNLQAVTQTGPGPLLSVALLAGTNFTLSWPTNNAGFALQTTTNLSSLNSWSNVNQTPVAIGGVFYVTNPLTGKSRFYRLVK